MLIDARPLPRHVGIIMDGNGRWAELRGLAREAGHRAGSDSVRRIVRMTRRLGIQALTLYAFSQQNWDRPDREVDALMGLLEEFLRSEHDEILGNDIRLVAVGDVSRLPEFVRKSLDPLADASSTNQRMTLALALSYGGREEVAAVARSIAEDVRAGRLDPSDVDEALVEKRVPSLAANGQPDLILRTGGETRLSNFLLYGAADSELIFSDRLWPDFDNADYFAVLSEYQRRLARRHRDTGAPSDTGAIEDGSDLGSE